MPFIVSQTFKVKLLLESSLWRNILIHLKKKVTPGNPLFLHFIQYGPEDVRVLINLISFNFGSEGDQKSSNAACNHIFFVFLSSHYGFLNYFQFFSFFFQQLCWICTSNKNTGLKWNSVFQPFCRICYGVSFEIIFRQTQFSRVPCLRVF